MLNGLPFQFENITDVLYFYEVDGYTVTDGDTLKCYVSIGFDTYVKKSFRLVKVDTPEIRGPERPQGLEVKEYVINLLEGKKLYLISKKKGVYGRWVADVFYVENEQFFSLSEHLLENGMGELYEK